MRPTSERRAPDTIVFNQQPTSKTKEIVVDYRMLAMFLFLDMFLSAYTGRRRKVRIKLGSWSSTSFIWPVLVSEHLLPGEESPTVALLPQEAEVCWTPLSAAREHQQRHIEHAPNVMEFGTHMETGHNFLIMKKKQDLIGPEAPPRGINSCFCAHLLPYYIKNPWSFPLRRLCTHHILYHTK